MPIYQIPSSARQFEITRTKSGEFQVVSDTSGTQGVVIPCHDEAEAEAVCDRLNRGAHDGTIDVPFRFTIGPPASRR